MSKSKKDKKKNYDLPEKQIQGVPKKNPFWFYIVMISIPIIFVVLLEVILRYLNYGYDFTYFVPASEYHSDKYFANPDLPRKYFFNINASPTVLPDGFDIVKKSNTFRIFILGESSAAGWPYVPNASFPRHLKRKLELLYPENNIEVINLGISAINTYTLRDFTKGIVEMEPDLVLIYTGHNEYYGALGVGSSVNLGYSRKLVNFYISIRDYKTVQFIQNIISSIMGLFKSSAEKEEKENGTLMSRMIGESLIPYESDLYNYGIDQFTGNMDDILKMLTDKNIPVIIGNLTCNIKDLKPFVSVKEGKYPPAEEVFQEANKLYGSGEIEKAKSLYLKAKELDALRFRAPQKINDAIFQLSQKYKIPFVNIDSVFRSWSKDGLVGNNLMVDHLHPNIEGYRIIGDSYLTGMQAFNILPNGMRSDITITRADSLLKANFPFTRLDSTVAEMQLISLTGSYPFVPKGTINYKVLNFRAKDFVDTLAVQLVNKDIRWETAHATLSDYYFKNGDYENCVKEMAAIIAERPYYDIPYKDVISKLVDKERLDEALKFLRPLYNLKPDYFACKWLGQVLLKQNNFKEAIVYLEQAVKFREADSQTWYNYGGALYLNGKLDEAFKALEMSLNINPQNALAMNFYNQLRAHYNK